MSSILARSAEGMGISSIALFALLFILLFPAVVVSLAVLHDRVFRGVRMWCDACQQKTPKISWLHQIKSKELKARCPRCGKPLKQYLQILSGEMIARLERRGFCFPMWTNRPAQRKRIECRGTKTTATPLQNIQKPTSICRTDSQCRQSQESRPGMSPQSPMQNQPPVSGRLDQSAKHGESNTGIYASQAIFSANVRDDLPLAETPAGRKEGQ